MRPRRKPTPLPAPEEPPQETARTIEPDDEVLDVDVAVEVVDVSAERTGAQLAAPADAAPRIQSILDQLSPDPTVERAEDTSIPDRLKAIIDQELSVEPRSNAPRVSPFSRFKDRLSPLLPKQTDPPVSADHEPPEATGSAHSPVGVATDSAFGQDPGRKDLPEEGPVPDPSPADPAEHADETQDLQASGVEEEEDIDPLDALLEFQETASPAEEAKEREKPARKRHWLRWALIGVAALLLLLMLIGMLSGTDPTGCTDAAQSLSQSARNWEKTRNDAESAAAIPGEQLTDPRLSETLGKALSEKPSTEAISCPTDSDQRILDESAATMTSRANRLGAVATTITTTAKKVTDSKEAKDLTDAETALDQKIQAAQGTLDSTAGKVSDDAVRQALQTEITAATTLKNDTKHTAKALNDEVGKLETASKAVSDAVAAKAAADQAAAAQSQVQSPSQPQSSQGSTPKRSSGSTTQRKRSGSSTPKATTPAPSTPAAPTAPSNPGVGVTIG